MVAVARTASRSVAEVALVFFVIGTFLWFARGSFAGVNPAFAVVLLTILIYAHRQAGEGSREIGFRRDTLAAAARLLLPIVLVCSALIVAVGLLLGEMHFPPVATGAPTAPTSLPESALLVRPGS